MPPAARLGLGCDAPSKPRPLYAYTRAKAVRSVNYLVAQGRHARREDRSGAARVRADAVPGTSLGWSYLDGPKPEPHPVHTTHYAAAHRAFVRRHGARLRKGAPLGLHLEVNLSSEWWVEAGGGLHEPANPRIVAHWNAVVAWSRNAFGEALFALRIDLDETGGGVADVFLAPLRRLGHKVKARAGQLWVSVNRAMEELTRATGHRNSEHWAAINTSWAAYARAQLDLRLERGTPREITRQRNLSPDLIRRMHEELDTEALALESEAISLTCREEASAHVLRAILLGWQLVEPDGRPPSLVAPRGWAHLPELAGEVDGRALATDLHLVWLHQAHAIRAAARLVERLVSWEPSRAAETITASPPATGRADAAGGVEGSATPDQAAPVLHPGELDPAEEIAQGPSPWWSW